MDSLFRDFPFIFIYLDDMLIFSGSRSDHLCHLDTVLAVLAENGLHINPAKCQFAQPEVDFLGHHVTAFGLSPRASHTQPIIDYPTLSDIKSKALLASAVPLQHPYPHATLSLATDASDSHVGAV